MITDVMIRNPAENHRPIGKNEVSKLQKSDQQRIAQPRQLKNPVHGPHAGKHSSSERPSIEPEENEKQIRGQDPNGCHA